MLNINVTLNIKGKTKKNVNMYFKSISLLIIAIMVYYFK